VPPCEPTCYFARNFIFAEERICFYSLLVAVRSVAVKGKTQKNLDRILTACLPRWAWRRQAGCRSVTVAGAMEIVRNPEAEYGQGWQPAEGGAGRPCEVPAGHGLSAGQARALRGERGSSCSLPLSARDARADAALDLDFLACHRATADGETFEALPAPQSEPARQVGDRGPCGAPSIEATPLWPPFDSSAFLSIAGAILIESADSFGGEGFELPPIRRAGEAGRLFARACPGILVGADSAA